MRLTSPKYSWCREIYLLGWISGTLIELRKRDLGKKGSFLSLSHPHVTLWSSNACCLTHTHVFFWLCYVSWHFYSIPYFYILFKCWLYTHYIYFKTLCWVMGHDPLFKKMTSFLRTWGEHNIWRTGTFHLNQNNLHCNPGWQEEQLHCLGLFHLFIFPHFRWVSGDKMPCAALGSESPESCRGRQM